MTDKCQTLLYNRTIHLSVYSPANLTNTYQIVVKANEPSNGEFKALVRRTAEDSFTMASTTIERMDRFGNHGICATDGLKHLCYCMNDATTMANSLSTVQSTHHLRVQTSSQIPLTNKKYS
uniref:Cadherin domain-containing protein n=1 Tax=Heterorhabditis bacteriophora TaxID=37862 RepID=A0A1I7XCP4_HETBA